MRQWRACEWAAPGIRGVCARARALAAAAGFSSAMSAMVVVIGVVSDDEPAGVGVVDVGLDGFALPPSGFLAKKPRMSMAARLPTAAS